MSTKYQTLIDIYKSRIKGRHVAIGSGHDGTIGHWVDRQYGNKANSDSYADWNGYELKTGKSKTTFGDWRARSYIWETQPVVISDRDHFLRIFGTPYQGPEKRKLGRYSWSGRVSPKIGGYNEYGQRLEINPAGDIFAMYDFQYDCRPGKTRIVPIPLQSSKIIIATWTVAGGISGTGRYYKGLKNLVEDKFGQNGWVKFVQDSSDRFIEMWIGNPLNFGKWIDLVKNGTVFLDSGMYQGNPRPYQNWRASNSYWKDAADHIVR